MEQVSNNCADVDVCVRHMDRIDQQHFPIMRGRFGLDFLDLRLSLTLPRVLFVVHLGYLGHRTHKFHCSHR